MVVSILHRFTGAALSIAGLAILAWWLTAIASGPGAYATFTGWVWADDLVWSGGVGVILVSVLKLLFKLVLVGLTWSFFQHLLSGIRHLVMDTGAAFEIGVNRTFAILTIVGSLLLTAVLWIYVLELRP